MKQEISEKRRIKRKFVILVMDILSIAGAFFFALWFRFDFSFADMPKSYLQEYRNVIPWWIFISIVVFSLCKLYSSVWTYASADEVFRIFVAYFILFFIEIFGIFVFNIKLPRSVYVVGFIFSGVSTVALRFSYRLLRMLRTRWLDFYSGKDRERVMIIGAGAAGKALLSEFKISTTKICCFIDDNPGKRKKILNGVEIYGGREFIPEAV